MTAVAYCMRDLHGSDKMRPGAVCVPRDSGGCGVPHEATKLDNGRWVIQCDDCAPRLVAKTYGFSSDAAGVPLSPDEFRANELAERDGKAAQSNVMAAMTEAFVNAIQQGGMTFPGGEITKAPPPAQKTLLEQLADMSPAERAQLGALLGAPAAVEAPKPEAAPAAKAPAARKPGRPRTTTPAR